MPEAYPIELRARVVRAYETDERSFADVAAQFAVGEASVKRWVYLGRKCGSLVAKPKGGRARSRISAAELDAIVARLGNPTALEITAEFNRQRRGTARVHVSSTKRALHRHGYVVKKNAAGRWRVSGRTSSPGGGRS